MVIKKTTNYNWGTYTDVKSSLHQLALFRRRVLKINFYRLIIILSPHQQNSLREITNFTNYKKYYVY